MPGQGALSGKIFAEVLKVGTTCAFSFAVEGPSSARNTVLVGLKCSKM